MNKLVIGALALTLGAALTACGGSTDPTGPVNSTSTGPTASLTTSGLPDGSRTSTTGETSSSGPSSTAPTSGGASSPSSTAPPVTIDQSTPEGAMTAWLGSMVSGDSTAVCALMASGGQPITEIKGAGARCSTRIAPTVSELRKVGAAFAGLRITGATVKGNLATFEKASTQPALAAKVISSLKAVKIGPKWYVTP